MARIFLAMNGKRINTLEELRLNFNGKQMLAFYKSQRLNKWLEESCMPELLETVKEFQSEEYDDETLLSNLMAIFEIDDSKASEILKEFSLNEEKVSEEHKDYSFAPQQTDGMEETKGTESPIVSIGYTPLERRLLEIKEQCIQIFKNVLKDDWCCFESNLGIGFENAGIPYDIYGEICPLVSEKFQIDDVMWYNGHSPETVILSVMAQKYFEAFDEYGLGIKIPVLKEEIAEHIGIKRYELEYL